MTTASQDLGISSGPEDSVSYSAASPSLHWGIFDKRENCLLLSRKCPSFQQQLNFSRRFPNQVKTKPTPALPFHRSRGHDVTAPGYCYWGDGQKTGLKGVNGKWTAFI